jgi:hypothetical protein
MVVGAESKKKKKEKEYEKINLVILVLSEFLSSIVHVSRFVSILFVRGNK